MRRQGSGWLGGALAESAPRAFSLPAELCLGHLARGSTHRLPGRRCSPG